MEWQMADLKAFALTEQLSMDLAEGRAWGMKLDSFGTLSKMTSLFQKPRDEDFQMAYKELRYEPFWHVTVMFKSVYQRERQYRMAPKGEEVRTVKILGEEFPVEAGQVTLSGIEHCEEQGRNELYVDGITGKRSANLAAYTRYPAKLIEPVDIASFAPVGAIIQAPAIHASALLREAIGEMVRTVEADDILGEGVGIEALELYFRPIYAFQFHWITKDKYGVVECDALTGQYRVDGKVLKDSPVEIPVASAIFDVDADNLDVLLPGGHVTVPAAK
ncbi:MAG: hypothetical protein GXY52_01340 [Chloroflexi bacterium]|nr:hypothetical protein [Chloroflexota bacterium]